MRCTTCVVLTVCLLIVSKASLLSKRQITSCPPNCFQCDGGTCRSCNSGWYGQNCSKSCSSCLGGCSQDTGHCLSCPEGTFSPLCNETCPIKCRLDIKGTVTCGKTNGHCDSGCKDGYYGTMCNLTCGHCTAGTCDPTTGNCNSTCANGWGGLTCSVPCITNCVFCSDNWTCNECSDGYYGPHCTETSSISSMEYITTLSAITSTFTAPYSSKVKVPTAATVDIIVGISFGVMLIMLLILVLVYTKRIKCPNICRRDEGMYKEDETGSPILRRKYVGECTPSTELEEL